MENICKNLVHLSKSQTFKPFCLDTKFKFDLYGNILTKEKLTALQHFHDKTIQQNVEEKQYIVRVSILLLVEKYDLLEPFLTGNIALTF